MKNYSKLFLIALALFTFSCEDDMVLKQNDVTSDGDDYPSAQSAIGLSNPAARGPESGLDGHFPLFQLFLYKTNAECDNKVNTMISHFFEGDQSQRIYFDSNVYPQEVSNPNTPSDEAYIFNMQPDNGESSPGLDVRSEGMSYGMMITVQLDMKTEFDKLWNWTERHMLNSNGYFAWRCRANGSVVDSNPAPDGEEYFAMALYFAYNRWGETRYKDAADAILTAMLNTSGGHTPMFGSNDLIVFQPCCSGTGFTDPSYHLPAFYELFAEWGPSSQSSRWQQIASASRQYLKTTIEKSPYGLVPDYTTFGGDGTGGDHADFRYDAWRTVMNVALDYIFSGHDEVDGDYGQLDGHYFAGGYTTRLLNFFRDEGIDTYTDLWDINGNQVTNDQGQPIGDHSVGLVAMNAVGARVCNQWSTIVAHAEEFWDIYIPEGTYRYYNGCLYMLSMLINTGNFNIYEPCGFACSQIRPLNVYFPNPSYGIVNLENEWTGRLLTATNTYNDADTKAQPENSSWNSQDWQLESVEGTGYYRLKNVWTGKYLNVVNQNESARVVTYDLHENWLSQQWILEPVDGSESVRFRNVWTGKYLTVESSSNYANIWSQSLNPSWGSQRWLLN